MTVRKITRDTNFLSRKAAAATSNDLVVADDLRDTLMANKSLAAGLAANMIKQNKRIIAFYLGQLPVVMLNPKIVAKQGEYQAREGCLSLLGERNTQRYHEITVMYQDMRLKTHTQRFTEFTAEVIQHEIDHCDGILI
ncbi:peptide deformylase [Lactobacillus corticis]|uniref:Peptide deformylase n=1 Tax=Lactobacillus corticis TaxID=2201249 RepID=A0A916VIQ7_9LACO|nr:peptide deformylase [Lactobacillus corticis]GFZ27765.1 peptide deformylase [Lactobacillus corticis]